MSRFAHYQLVRNIGRSTSRTYFTHFIPTFARASPVFEETPQCLGRYSKRHFSLLTKSRIGSVFSRYAPKLDLGAYIAAAQVFPMRANNFVVEELIDWLVLRDIPLICTSPCPYCAPVNWTLSRGMFFVSLMLQSTTLMIH